MGWFRFLGTTITLTWLGFAVSAQEPMADPVSVELEVQVALHQARDLLSQGRSAQAVSILEQKLPLIKGHPDFLATLREAYAAVIRDLKLQNQEERVRQYQRKLRLLEAMPPKAPTNTPEKQKKGAGHVVRDPFQQEPVSDNDAEVRDWLRRGSAAFEAGRFAEASELFGKVHHHRPDWLGPRLADWAYCRVAAVVDRLKAGPVTDPEVRRRLDAELTEAIKLSASKPELAEFAQNVRRRLHDGITPVRHADVTPAGWSATLSKNFRLLHHLPVCEAQKILKVLEQQLVAAREKWGEGSKATWSSPCDVYIHPTGIDYRKATGKDPRGWGHATVELVDGQIVRRQMDFPGDEPDFATAAIPREVTHLVLVDRFPDPPLPRWAEEAIAILSMPRSYVEQYLLALPRLARDGHLLAWDRLLSSTDFPPAESMTAFYVQSVSLADVLIADKGPRQFLLFLKRAEQQGVERALRESYGFRSLTSLNDYWKKKAFDLP